MKIARNILAIVGGIVVGSVLNMSMLELGVLIIPNPEGFDNSTMDTLANTIHLLTPINFIIVFLAHGLGTLAGSFVAAKIAVSKQQIMALVIGAWFLIGGIVMVFLIPSPVWFTIVDLIGAYLPMAWLGWKLAGRAY